jgi:hypothetical protein
MPDDEVRPARQIDQVVTAKLIERIADHRITGAAGVALCLAALDLDLPKMCRWLPGLIALGGAVLGTIGALRWSRVNVDRSRYEAELQRRDNKRLYFVTASWGMALLAALTWYVLTIFFSPA